MFSVLYRFLFVPRGEQKIPGSVNIEVHNKLQQPRRTGMFDSLKKGSANPNKATNTGQEAGRMSVKEMINRFYNEFAVPKTHVDDVLEKVFEANGWDVSKVGTNRIGPALNGVDDNVADAEINRVANSFVDKYPTVQTINQWFERIGFRY